MRKPKAISTIQLLERAIRALDRSQDELAEFAHRMNAFEERQAAFRDSRQFVSARLHFSTPPLTGHSGNLFGMLGETVFVSR